MRIGTVLPSLLLCLVPATAAADTAAPSARAAVYRLGTESLFVEGCVPPCRCGVTASDDLRGTFRVVPEVVSRDELRFEVVDVLWVVTDASGEELRFTGSGLLTVSGGRVQAAMDLSRNGAAPVRYRSDPAPADGLPRLRLKLRVPDAECFTDGFRLDASPAPADAIRPYALTLDASYAFGCIISPCDCPVTAQGMLGDFGLLPLGTFDGRQELALVGIRWHLAAPSTIPLPGDPVRGVAIYRLDGGRQEMFGEFSIGEGEALPFESGIVDGADPPFLDITMYDEGDECVNQALHVVAAPGR